MLHGRSAERGFSLIVSLMMLIVIIILGISASQMSVNEERAARNDRDRQIAFQAAEAALKDAEFEIRNPASPICTAPGQLNRGRMRTGTAICFNEGSSVGFVPGCSDASGPGREGLCDSISGTVSWTLVDFAADAAGAATIHTTQYGRFTGHAFGSQATLGTDKPISRYPPRYIIELVFKNTAADTKTGPGIGGGAGDGYMFRVTAMGFGANPSSQVVLQTVVATQD